MPAASPMSTMSMVARLRPHMRQMPADSQVSTDRIFTFSMPPSSMAIAISSSISWRPGPVCAGRCARRARARSSILGGHAARMRSLASMMSRRPSARNLETEDGAAVLFRDRDVRATSTRRRVVAGVRRLEGGVGQAFRAPCVG
jgi:hypothetical protein